MMLATARKRGLGAALVPFSAQPTPDNILACSDSQNYYLWRPDCWSYSLSAWKEMAQYGSPAMPPVVGAPADLTTPPASGQDAQNTVDSVLADQWSRWLQQNQDFFDAQPTVNADNSTLYAWLIGGGAALLLLWLFTR